jgi:hypothetical protein
MSKWPCVQALGRPVVPDVKNHTQSSLALLVVVVAAVTVVMLMMMKGV